MLRTDLRFCKRKSSDQTKQITELQNMLAEQQKQMLDYANRLDENDKKSEEMSRKISTLLQELNKCKIELHYYRSTSPATPIRNNCGQTKVVVPPSDLITLLKQTISGHDGIVDIAAPTQMRDIDLESEVQSYETNNIYEVSISKLYMPICHLPICHLPFCRWSNANELPDGLWCVCFR